jgi:hypothetical protein
MSVIVRRDHPLLGDPRPHRPAEDYPSAAVGAVGARDIAVALKVLITAAMHDLDLLFTAGYRLRPPIGRQVGWTAFEDDTNHVTIDWDAAEVVHETPPIW